MECVCGIVFSGNWIYFPDEISDHLYAFKVLFNLQRLFLLHHNARYLTILCMRTTTRYRWIDKCHYLSSEFKGMNNNYQIYELVLTISFFFHRIIIVIIIWEENLFVEREQFWLSFNFIVQIFARPAKKTHSPAIEPTAKNVGTWFFRIRCGLCCETLFSKSPNPFDTTINFTNQYYIEPQYIGTSELLEFI